MLIATGGSARRVVVHNPNHNPSCLHATASSEDLHSTFFIALLLGGVAFLFPQEALVCLDRLVFNALEWFCLVRVLFHSLTHSSSRKKSMKPTPTSDQSAFGETEVERTLLSSFCVGDYESLGQSFGALRVKHLRSYTKDELVKFVRDEHGPAALVPPFLSQQLSDGHTLESFLRVALPAAVEPDQKRLKPMQEVPSDLEKRVQTMLVRLGELSPYKLDEKAEPAWPLCDRDAELKEVVEAANNNRFRFNEQSRQKQAWNCVVVTGAAGSGKTRFIKEAAFCVSQSVENCCATYNVLITFVNGEEITEDDHIDDNLLVTERASVALGIRVACKLFPLVGACSAMPFKEFRRGLQGVERLFDLRTVMHTFRALVQNQGTGVSHNTPIWVTLALDEIFYVEKPHDKRAPPDLWPKMMSAILDYMIPSDFAPQLMDSIGLFPILASTWTEARTRFHVTPVGKVFPKLQPLSEQSLFERICTPQHLGPLYTEVVAALLHDAGFRAFLLSFSLAPRALKLAMEAVAKMQQFDVGYAVKAICQLLRDFYQIESYANIGDVLEFALSGIIIPPVDKFVIGGQSFEHWMSCGFASGAEGQPMHIPFPLLYNKAGQFICKVDKFLSWGQPFYWQDFEEMVPHIIRLRVLSLYRIRGDHKASLCDVFGVGPPRMVLLDAAPEVVTCSEQWLGRSTGGQKDVAEQLMVKKRDDRVAAGEAGSLCFGSTSHIFAAAKGNVHFDGHTSFLDDSGDPVLVCYQAKHTHINIDQDVKYFKWSDVSKWLVQARAFMKTYAAKTKLFMMVTNKEVRDVPAISPPDLILIHQGNLALFFAPCLLSSAKLAKDKAQTQ